MLLGVMSTMMIPLSFFLAIWTGVAEDLPIILKLMAVPLQRTERDILYQQTT